MNLQGSINLLKLDKAGLATIDGKSGPKLCVVIPVEDNDIYVSRDNALRPKAAYLSFAAWANRGENGVDKYGNSHYVKQSFSKEYREGGTGDGMRDKPIIGNLKRLVMPDKADRQIDRADNAQTTHVAIDSKDDLPF